ncbi:cell division protein FtsB [Sinimarinibacterium sp. CAU 1509]|uniref:septum formation initiator family protein n=1 Tax=Sinimarinibacterium sp. CAU 1509 TaxID=2562283 RepID=UPI0010AD6F90|nr:septum formation initiator family protein [Sinimarinibacterium sp. CAU 1509]TJY62102.1 cell division protein FtsB [Sinimarinibacterium sp. CAU 1509]
MNRRTAIIAGLVLVLLGLQWRLWIADGGVSHTHRLKQQVAKFSDQNEQLRVRNAALDAEVRDLGTGTAAIEARARTTLGMIKQGETFYLVVHR